MGAISQTIFSKGTFLKKNIWISINISLKFVPRCPIDIIPATVQIMAWRRPSDKLLSEPMMVSLMTHICVTRPQRVKCISQKIINCIACVNDKKFTPRFRYTTLVECVASTLYILKLVCCYRYNNRLILCFVMKEPISNRYQRTIANRSVIDFPVSAAFHPLIVLID